MKSAARFSSWKALTALALLAALALLVYAAVPAGASSHEVDYDQDDDGLIDITSIAELQAIRFDHNGDGVINPALTNDVAAYDLAYPNRDMRTSTFMGCPGGVCVGYELRNDLDFATATSSQRDWVRSTYNYETVFEGNGFTISNMNADQAGTTGLIKTLHASGTVRNVGLINPTMRGHRAVGTLVSTNRGMVYASYADGGHVSFTGDEASLGGLVAKNEGLIIASFANVRATSTHVTSTQKGISIGGLAGENEGGEIIASYAAGRVAATAFGPAVNIGGLVGLVKGTSSAVTASYCDTTVNTSTDCIGDRSEGATATSTGYSTTQLRMPTGYTGIYAGWNVDRDGIEGADYPWNFGTTTEYPKPNTPAERATARAAAMGPGPGMGTGTTTGPGGGTGTTTGPGGGTGTTTGPGPGGGTGTTTDPGGGTRTTTDPGGGTRTTTDPRGETGTTTDTLPPPLPRSIPPEPERDYDPAADHPEIYDNAEYGMSARCETRGRDAARGIRRSATVTFELGSYTGPVLLHLSIWRDGRYMAYETQGIALPALEREGQRAWVRVETDPGDTRFRLDGRRNGLAANLVLGYADCRRDGP